MRCAVSCFFFILVPFPAHRQQGRWSFYYRPQTKLREGNVFTRGYLYTNTPLRRQTPSPQKEDPLLRRQTLFHYMLSSCGWSSRSPWPSRWHVRLPSIPPLLKHACGEGDWLLCWHYIPANVLHQRRISGNVYYVRLRKFK